MLTRDFVQALPKAELHLHLEGAVPWAMVRAHAPDLLPERPAWWADDFRFADFTHFRRVAQTCVHCLTDLAAYRRAAEAIFAGLGAQNVRYVEISFDSVRVAGQALDFGEVIGAIKAGAPPGVSVRVFGAFSYHKPDRMPDGMIDAVLDAQGLDGIDLHGDETWQTTARFADVFIEARRKGLATKAHAGELVGPARSRTRRWSTGSSARASRSTCVRGRT